MVSRNFCFVRYVVGERLNNCAACSAMRETVPPIFCVDVNLSARMIVDKPQAAAIIENKVRGSA